MRLAVTIEFEGRVFALARDAPPPDEGLAYRADGEAQKMLYIDGHCVGYLTEWPASDYDRAYFDRAQGVVPVNIPTRTTMRAMLFFGERPD